MMEGIGKLTGTVHGDEANDLVAFYHDKVSELAAAEREDNRPPKHVASDVVDAVRKFRNLIHPGRALKEGYDPRKFTRDDFENLKEMYECIMHSLMHYL